MVDWKAFKNTWLLIGALAVALVILVLFFSLIALLFKFNNTLLFKFNNILFGIVAFSMGFYVMYESMKRRGKE